MSTNLTAEEAEALNNLERRVGAVETALQDLQPALKFIHDYAEPLKALVAASISSRLANLENQSATATNPAEVAKSATATAIVTIQPVITALRTAFDDFRRDATALYCTHHFKFPKFITPTVNMNTNNLNSVTGSNAVSPIIPANPSLPASGNPTTIASSFAFLAGGNPVRSNENVANVPGNLANISDNHVNLGERTHNTGNLATNHMELDEHPDRGFINNQFAPLPQFVHNATDDIIGVLQQLDQRATELSHKRLRLVAQQAMISDDEPCPPGLIEYINSIDKDLNSLMTRQRLLESALNQHKQVVRPKDYSNNKTDRETNPTGEGIDRSGPNNHSGSEDQHLAPKKGTPRNQQEQALGKANFFRDGPRLLSLVILDNKIMDDYIHRMRSVPEEDLNWDRCEDLFIAAALKPDQQRDEVAKVLLAGIETKDKESYKSYAARLQRIARMYKLSDGDQYYLELMKNSLPVEVLNFMTLSLMYRHNNAALTDSIDKFCSALSMATIPYEEELQELRRK
ncbi:hypothetical protein EDD21DRAFT_448804 [Dissophora ornata]|nr:hypothetical protein EDD21DRAFT_448804 [Dissophora ornata]